MDVERLVGGDGPGGGGPDHRVGVLARRQGGETEGGGELLGFGADKAHVDGRAGFVLVFHFRFGQRRAAVETPVDRLQALEHPAALDHLGQRPHFAGFVGEVHGQVGIVPVSEYAEADEFLLLHRHLFGGVGPAQFAHLVGGQALAVGDFDLVFDGQTVAVPARHVGRVEASQGLGADDDVLEDLVEGMAQVQVAVGVGRAVVQDELGPAGRSLADFLIELALLPVGDPFGFALGEIAAHREGRVGQVQGLAGFGHGR